MVFFGLKLIVLQKEKKMSAEKVIIAILIVLGVVGFILIKKCIIEKLTESEDDQDEDDQDEDNQDEDEDTLRKLLKECQSKNIELCAEMASYQLERGVYWGKFMEVLRWYGIARVLHPEILGEINDAYDGKTIAERIELCGKFDPSPEIAVILKKMSEEQDWQSLRNKDIHLENNLSIEEFLEKSTLAYNEMIANVMSEFIINFLAEALSRSTSDEATDIIVEAVALLLKRQDENVQPLIKKRLSEPLYDRTGNLVPILFTFVEDKAEN